MTNDETIPSDLEFPVPAATPAKRATKARKGTTKAPQTGLRPEAPTQTAKATSRTLGAWRTGMNPEQLQAIEHGNGPLVLLAQAGSGKTRALIARVARLVEEGCPAERILAVTFSSKAAREMEERGTKVGLTARFATWHSLCLQILKEDQTPQGSWEIDASDRHKFIVKDVLGYKYLDWKQADLNQVRSFISWCKANLWDYDSAEAADEAKKRFGGNAKLAVQAYHLSQDITEERGLLTFDDFLVFAARHLGIEENRAKWAARFDHMLQDEAQDSNNAQNTIAEMLTRDHKNYTIVGDPAQSIYGFRGSKPDYIMAFEQTYSAKAVYMNRNYRSGKAIVNVANLIIGKAKMRLPVDMLAERAEEGSVRVCSAHTLDDEANEFVQHVRNIVASGGKYGDVTCLFRTNAQSRALEEGLLAAKLPYVVVGGTSFYERKEVKDVLAYLRVAAGRDQDGDAVKRCINAPFRFLGAKFVERVMRNSDPRASWGDIVLRSAREAGIQARQVGSAQQWASIIAGVARQVSEDDKPATILNDLVTATGYIKWLEQDQGAESIEQSGAANVRELCRVADKFGSVSDLLDYIEKSIAAAKKQSQSKDGDRVLLMSIHRSKGLEWPHVWVTGCNEKILPHVKGDPEEERRLMYVATTRARDSLVLGYVRTLAMRTGVEPALPSRYLQDAGLVAGDGGSDEEEVALELALTVPSP